nr:MAG TPA: hypothetical protein [Caudoviricetes sp.]
MIGITNAGGRPVNVPQLRLFCQPSAPTNSKHGDIFVVTSVPCPASAITSYNIQPGRVDQAGIGYVFININGGGNAIQHLESLLLAKKTKIELSAAFTSVVQKFTDGVYHMVDAYIYDTNDWFQISKAAPLWDGYLYKLGNNQYTDYTGGWVGGTYNSEGTLDFTASGDPDSIIRTAKAVDLTNFNTLVFDGIMWGNNSGGAWGGNMIVCSGADGSGVVAQKNIGTTAWGQYSLDISSVKGSYYVRFHVGGNDHSIRMRNCYLQ